MSLYDEVKQGFYKDAINKLAKKTDDLDEDLINNSLSFKYDYCQAETAEEFLSISANECAIYTFELDTDYDFVIPIQAYVGGMQVGYGTFVFGVISSVINSGDYHISTEPSDVSGGNVWVNVTYFNMYDEDISINPMLIYVGIKKGE